MSADKKLTELTLLSATKSSDLMYIVTYVEGVAVSRAITTLALLQNTITGVNRIISGQVIWTGVGFVHKSINLLYEINGIIYFSNDEDITNDAPDGSNPRFDVIFVDLDGLDIKKGTPAGSPTVPSLDNPDSEIGTNIVLVTNGETTPTGVTLATVYSENLQESGGEWDTLESTAGARIDLANTSNPINGTKDIKAIAPEEFDYFNFNHSVAVQIEDFQSLQFKIKSLGNWKADYIRVEFYDGVNFAGYTFINAGFFDTKDTTTIVNFVITKDNISWTVDFVEFDIIRFMWFDGGGGSSVSSAKFQIDVIKLEAGGITTDPISDLSMDVMKNMTNSKTTPIDADNLTLWDSVAEQFKKLSFSNLITYLDTKYKTHTGEVTGEQALSLDKTAISNQDEVSTAGADHLLIIDATDGLLKKILASDLLGGGGDMLVATYDPETVGADAFDMDNMAEGATTKIFTGTERTKLTGIETAADVTDAVNVGSSMWGADAKTTPVDADTIPLNDSADSNLLKKVTWANIKATLKAYFDGIYAILKFEEHLIIEFNPKGTELAIDTGLREFQMPDYATTLYQVPSVQLTDPPTGSVATFDLNEGGASVLSTKITIDATEKTSETAATQPVLSDSAIAANAIMSIDIDGIGSTNPGEGGKLILYYKRA